MYGEKQIISPNSTNNADIQTNGIPNIPTPTNIDHNDKKAIKTDILDLAAIFVGFFAVYFLATFVFYIIGFGVTLAYLGFLAFTTVYITTKQKHFPVKAVFPLCLCVLISLCYSLHYVDVFSLAIPFLFYLSGLYCMSLTKTKGYEFCSYISLYNQIKASFFLPVAKLFLPLSSLWKNRINIKFKRSYWGVIIGMLCGIPVFVVVAKLLSEGDAAFSGIMNGFVDKVSDFLDKILNKAGDFTDPLLIIIALIFTPWIVSTIFAFRHRVITEKLNNSKTEETIKNFRFVSVGVLSGFYGIVSLCYVLYLVSQFSYLFGAFSGEVPMSVSITLSEYARRGFFEMSTVAFINLCLIGAGAILSKRDEKENLPKLYKVFSLFFCLFTILLIVTAMSKMGLYITELGLTQKRILVSLTDIILLVTFICILIKLFKNSFPYTKITMSTALVLVTLYFVVSPDFMISRFNTWAYLSGYHETIDLKTLSYLEDDYQSAMAFDKLAQSKNEVVTATAKSELYDYYSFYLNTDISDEDLENNFSSLRLVKYLKENEATIKEYEKFGYYGVHYEYDINKLMSEAVQNGLYEVKTVEFTLSVNSTAEIYDIYLSNPYSSASITDYDSGVSLVAFKWQYSTNPDEDFATIEIDSGYESHELTIKLTKTSTDTNSDTVTYITKDTFSFELRDDGEGGFVLVEL